MASPLVTMTGCLKDKNYDDGINQSIHSDNKDLQKVVEISLTTTNTTNYLSLSFDKSPRDTVINLIPVSLAGGIVADQDIKVVMVKNASLIGDHNANSGASSAEAPANSYTVQNPASSDGTGYVVTIPKGQSMAFLSIKMIPNTFLGKDYAVGYQIARIETPGYLVSSNLSRGVVSIGIKNEYDGIYSLKGYTLRAGDASLTGYFTKAEWPLVTSGATSVAYGATPLWGDGNSGIAIQRPNLSINTAAPLPGGAFPVTISTSDPVFNNPGYQSKYDPATKTFYISFTWGAGPAARLSTDTLTYVKPR